MKKPIKITFDTNVLDRCIRPARFPKELEQSEYIKIRDALVNGTVKGFICETIVTIEGIRNRDRAAVFSSTKLRSQIQPQEIRSDRAIEVPITIKAEQKRPPTPHQIIERVQAALDVGIRVLGAPRVASTRIADPNATIYAQETPEELGKRLNLYHIAIKKIEERQLGGAQIRNLAKSLTNRSNVIEPWYASLSRTQSDEEAEAVQLACAEWADGDSMAAHIGYNNDVFCTKDIGKSAKGDSILSLENRIWLETNFNVKFATVNELASML